MLALLFVKKQPYSFAVRFFIHLQSLFPLFIRKYKSYDNFIGVGDLEQPYGFLW